MKNLLKYPWIWIIGILTVYFGSYYLILALGFCPPNTANELGDTFGAVNAFFGAGAVILVLLTLRQQQEEINGQQKELKLQRFESNFYGLIDTPYIRVVAESFKQIEFMNEDPLFEKK